MSVRSGVDKRIPQGWSQIIRVVHQGDKLLLALDCGHELWRTKKDLIDRAAKEPQIMRGSHMPCPGCAKNQAVADEMEDAEERFEDPTKIASVRKRGVVVVRSTLL